MTDALVEAVARAVAGEDGYPDHDDGRGDDDTWWQMYQRHATAALQAIEAAGYRVVPVEASQGYRQEIWSLLEANAAAGNISAGHIAGNGMPDAFYAAMLSAAPRVGEG